MTCGSSPLLSLFCHVYSGKKKMDTSETFSPGPGMMGLNQMASPPFFCFRGQCTRWTIDWQSWGKGEPLWGPHTNLRPRSSLIQLVSWRGSQRDSLSEKKDRSGLGQVSY